MVSAGDETAERGAWRPAWLSYLNNVTSRSRWTKIDDDVSDKTSAGDGVDEQTGQQTTTLYRNANGHPRAPPSVSRSFFLAPADLSHHDVRSIRAAANDDDTYEQTNVFG